MKKLISLVLIIIPSLVFAFLVYLYKDLFYLFFSIGWLLVGALVLMPQKSKKINKSPAKVKKPKMKFKLSSILKKFTFIKKNITSKSFKQHNLLRYYLIVGILSLVFTGLIIFKASANLNKNIFLDFILSYIYLMRSYWVIFLIIVVFTYLALLIPVRKLSKRKLSLSLIKIFSTILSSLLVSTILMFIIAIVDANLIAARSKYFPQTLSIKTNSKLIAKELQNMEMMPKIVGGANNADQLLLESGTIFIHHGQLYSKVLAALPSFLHAKLTIPTSPIFLVNNTLIIREINRDSIQDIGPVIASKYLKNYFDGRYLKENIPTIDVINRQDYLKYRDEQIDKSIARIEAEVEGIKKNLGVAASNIKQEKNNISTIQSYIAINSQYRDNEYQNCKTASNTIYGYGYYSDYTYRLYSDAVCESQRNARNAQNADYQAELEASQKNLSYWQYQYGVIKDYLEQTENLGDFVAATKSMAPQELGIFEPEDKIKIVLESTDNKAIADFLATLVHEHLHYTSYSSEDRTLPLFFEEGLTEYFSRQIVASQLGIKTNIGYPLITRMMEEFMKKVDPKELETIYFNKDSDTLKALMDNRFGKNFYADSELYFMLIPYSPNDKALKYADNIMYKIDGSKISEEEIFSSSSEFN